MSHDRGCFRCFEDRPYDGCMIRDCPQRPPGGWPERRGRTARYWQSVYGALWHWHEGNQ